MTFTAAQIAQIIQARIEGDAAAKVNGFGKIEEATNQQLSFLANLKYEEYLYATQAGIVILNENYQLKSPISATILRVTDAYSAFATLLNAYQNLQQQELQGIESPSFIAPTATCGTQVYIGAFVYLSENVKIGDNTKIHPHTFIGKNVQIGENCVIHAGVKIYNDCVLGNRVTIHAGTVIGSDGFGFAPQADGSFAKVPQLGNVVIEDDVEIGANTTIDRATIGSTLVKKGAKLDNLIQVAHNVEIGESTVIASQAGISGSTKIGKGVMIGGQAGIVGHIHLGDGAKINAQSGVSKSVEAGQAVTGSPAFDYKASLRSQAVARKLPDMAQRISDLEAELKTLKENLLAEKSGLQ